MTRKKKKLQRRGKPFTVYFREAQASELDTLSRTRHVPKSELVRLALERFFDDIKGGQLDLPLGVEKP